MNTTTLWTIALSASLASCAMAPNNRHRTLADTDSLELERSGSWLLAAKPRILNYQSSAKLPSDINRAIEGFDSLSANEIDPLTRIEAQRRAAYLRILRAEAQDERHQQDLQPAIDSLQALIHDAPDDPNLHQTQYQLARAYQLNGDEQRASDMLRQISLSTADGAILQDVLFRLAELEFRNADYRAAAQHYQQLIQLEGQSAFDRMARYKLGWAHFRDGDYLAAMDVFAEVLAEQFASSAQASDLDSLTAGLQPDDPWVADALLVTSLSLAELGGAPALDKYFESADRQPEHLPIIYAALVQHYLDKQMINAAADSQALFSVRHPYHALAPQFDQQRIELYQNAGFQQQTLEGLEQFVSRYRPDTHYWKQQPEQPKILQQVQAYLHLLAGHCHAQAQAEPDQAQAHYAQAIAWYQVLLEQFPSAEDAPRVELLLAEALQANQQINQAVQHFMNAAYQYPEFAGAQDAAYAALLLLQEQSDKAPTDRTRSAAIQAGLKLVAEFPEHPQRADVLLQTAHNQYAMKDWAAVIVQADQLLATSKLPVTQTRQATSLRADAQFALGDFASAETSYLQLRQLSPDPDQHEEINELIARAIYRQAEQAQAKGQWTEAADHFLRIALKAPHSSIRLIADFDAASAFIKAGQLSAAEEVLAAFMLRAPDHELSSEARRKLAVLYEGNGKIAAAADLYAKISQDLSLSHELKEEACWHAAELYQSRQNDQRAFSVYADYVRRFSNSFERAQQARQRLAQISRDQLGDVAQYSHWLEALVRAEDESQLSLSSSAKLRASQAALELGRLESARADEVWIQAPFEQTLALRQTQMQRAIDWFAQAAKSNLLETKPAAVHAMANTYRSFAKALLTAKLPGSLDELEQEEMRFLLEEQAFPIEELAIELYEQNLAQLAHGSWSEWIDQSTQALATLVPAQYSQLETLERSYAKIH